KAPTRPDSAAARWEPVRSETKPLMLEAYDEVTSDPSTATPSAPPSSRVVSFMAEPTPALDTGTAAMISVVSGVMARATPVARNMIGTYIHQMAVSPPMNEKLNSPTATEPRPSGTIRFTPKALTRRGT